MGFQSPNHTQTPNDLFDEHLQNMDKAELKVVLAVIRLTLGFHLRKRRISLSVIQRMTGLGRQHVISGADLAVDRGLIKKHNDGGVTEYEIFWNDDGSNVALPEAVTLGNQTGNPRELPSIKESSKEKKEKDFAIFFPEKPGQDLGSYPEDVRPYVEGICELWRLSPPAPSKKKGGEFADWILGSRELKQACGEFGTDLLLPIFIEWDREREENTSKGKPHWWVTRPGGLVRVARAKAGELRLGTKEIKTADEFSAVRL